jgi:hypothetical protein
LIYNFSQENCEQMGCQLRLQNQNQPCQPICMDKTKHKSQLNARN